MHVAGLTFKKLIATWGDQKLRITTQCAKHYTRGIPKVLWSHKEGIKER